MSHMEAEFQLQQFHRSLALGEAAPVFSDTRKRSGRLVAPGRCRSLLRRMTGWIDGVLRSFAGKSLPGAFSRVGTPRTRCG